ncbi:B3 domain-containing protein Os01g0234100-like [Henckelia pumila]|uniref:B3 domain-containing protein Os01g0234100-like n=1 Tax=Henckelia pumila TaxID=405737 RepID=UPI003C6E07C8
MVGVVTFQDVKTFSNFKIYLDNHQILDSELPARDKTKYYELCRGQKMFLHGNLIDGLSGKLVAAMISKTTTIADDIKSVNPIYSIQDLERWDKTFKCFEDLGMSLGFLRARIDKLVEISRKYNNVSESCIAKYALVEEKKAALKTEVWTLAERIADLKASIKTAEAEIDGFKKEMEDIDSDYCSIALAPLS